MKVDGARTGVFWRHQLKSRQTPDLAQNCF
jgi:hypothetical protein